MPPASGPARRTGAHDLTQSGLLPRIEEIRVGGVLPAGGQLDIAASMKRIDHDQDQGGEQDRVGPRAASTAAVGDVTVMIWTIECAAVPAVGKANMEFER